MNKVKKRVIYTIICTFIVVFTTTFAILMALERKDYRNYLQAQYSKNLYQLINAVQNIRSSLGKSNIIESKDQKLMVLDDIFRYSSVANDKLHSLPIDEQDVQKTSKFLSQLADYSYCLERDISEGKELSNKEADSIDVLEVESFELEQRLSRILNDINSGKIKWGEIRKKASGIFNKSNENSINNKFLAIQKQIMQYPTLIYDGPFADNNLEIKPKIYQQKQVSKKDAENIIKKVINKNKIESIKFKGEDTKSKINAYEFNVFLKENNKDYIACEISKNGGKIVYLLNNRNSQKTKLSIDEAYIIGKEFLDEIGFENMIPTYTLKYNNIVTINYVYKKDNLVIYPDQIKLKIALDNGQIIGIETAKYLTAHDENRKIKKPKLSLNEARSKVNKNLKIISSKLCIIPTELNKEKLCYEFTGTYKGKEYIVYIDAENGYERKIMEIIETPNGKLTL